MWIVVYHADLSLGLTEPLVAVLGLSCHVVCEILVL